MTPLPAPLEGGGLVAWRLDQAVYEDSWDSGEGAYRYGGRWNSKGVRAVYCAIDPATAILEVAVHKGFFALDTVPHALTSFAVSDPSRVHVVKPSAIPNANWLKSGIPSATSRPSATNCWQITRSSSSRAPFRHSAGRWFSSLPMPLVPMPSGHKRHLRWTRG